MHKPFENKGVFLNIFQVATFLVIQLFLHFLEVAENGRFKRPNVFANAFQSYQFCPSRVPKVGSPLRSLALSESSNNSNKPSSVSKTGLQSLKNASNSSKPPSSDITKPKKKRKISGQRKRGAQLGHKGKTHVLLPIEEVDKIVSCIPKTCSHCASAFLEQRDENPQRHQVTEIPPVGMVQNEDLQGNNSRSVRSCKVLRTKGFCDVSSQEVLPSLLPTTITIVYLNLFTTKS